MRSSSSALRQSIAQEASLEDKRGLRIVPLAAFS